MSPKDFRKEVRGVREVTPVASSVIKKAKHEYVERWTGDLTSGISCTVPTLANSSELLISGFIGSDQGGNRFFVSFPTVFDNEYGYNSPSLIDINENIYRMTMYYNKNDNSFKMSAPSTIHVTKICTR